MSLTLEETDFDWTLVASVLLGSSENLALYFYKREVKSLEESHQAYLKDKLV